jgi:hypothetical protein
LNVRPLPDLLPIAPEVAVFGGVLEYLGDVPVVLNWLVRSGVHTCITSFDPVPARLGNIARPREWYRRRNNGYLCNLTEAALLRTFEAAGFVCTQKRDWTTQSVFQFRMKN